MSDEVLRCVGGPNDGQVRRTPVGSDTLITVTSTDTEPGIGGSYEWDGVLATEFTTPNGDKRVVVAHPVGKGWLLHIYRDDQIEKL